jgi:hypothetical protein
MAYRRFSTRRPSVSAQSLVKSAREIFSSISIRSTPRPSLIVRKY